MTDSSKPPNPGGYLIVDRIYIPIEPRVFETRAETENLIPLVIRRRINAVVRKGLDSFPELRYSKAEGIYMPIEPITRSSEETENSMRFDRVSHKLRVGDGMKTWEHALLEMLESMVEALESEDGSDLYLEAQGWVITAEEILPKYQEFLSEQNKG